MSAQPNQSRLKSFGFGVIAFLLSGIFMLGVSEIALRILDYRQDLIDPGMFAWSTDPLRPFSLRPGYRGAYAGGRVSVAADGLREVPGQAKGTRVQTWIVGDSVAFGQGLDDDQTVAARLAAVAGNLGPVGLIGVPGYTSWNEFRAVQLYSNLGAPKQIVLIYVANDITMDNNQFKQKDGHISDLNPSVGHTILFWVYQHLRIAYLISDGLKRLMAAGQKGPANNAQEFDIRQNGPALDYSMDALAKLKALCAARGVNLYVAIYRGGSIYTQPKFTHSYEAAVSAGLDRIGVSHFVIHRQTDVLPEGKLSVSWNDPHPGVAATELMARQIADEIKVRESRAR